jgi:hypothetical protein
MGDYDDWRWEREARLLALPGGSAGAGSVYNFPGVVRFNVRTVSFRVATAAGGTARQAVVQLVDAFGAAVFTVAAPATQAGALTVDYSFSAETQTFGSAALGAMGAGFLRGELPQNLTLLVSIFNAAGADSISNVRVLVSQIPRDVGYPALAPAAA